ncbi:hypothetical protein H2200_012122 [Cladophialophora chaetospira]|uniref:Heterokaryon incompatibility domain-containing protein n=1 Tax=Cladophialophora chaetospira TaxID=386627 RepID=A0AA38WY84_9EURO|nr:hypothetical protein H2200_012122 [Cladophialophora chaetospira]
MIVPKMVVKILICLRTGFDESEIAGTEYQITSRSTGSRNALTSLKRLLDDCHDHPECDTHRLRHRENRRLPTRLVDLTEIANDGTINIVKGKDLGIETAYMTLSHCWGGLKPQALLDSGKGESRPECQLDCLPATFRDACLTALYLDCNYIWIDYLCIVQDSEEDWLRESAFMTDVFSRSTLTIAASASKDPSEGLFRNRGPYESGHFRTRASCACKGTWLGGPQDTPDTYGDGCDWSWKPMPLHERGWVIQEMVLSTRVAYFTDTGIYWMCKTIMAHEMRAYPDRTKHSVSSRVRPHEPACVRDWIELVSTYSESKITYVEDRLVAIAGLAWRCANEAYLGRYLAGLWEYEMTRQLLWDSREEKSRPKSKYSPPSWSWASVEGRVVFQGLATINENLLEIIEVKTKPVGDEFGPVDGGRMQTRVRLLLLRIKVDFARERERYRAIPSKKQNLEGDTRNAEDINNTAIAVNALYVSEADNQLVTAQAAGTFGVQEAMRIWLDEPMKITSDLQFAREPKFIMPVAYGATDHGPPEGYRLFYGLLVEPISTSPGHFRRIGLVETEPDRLEDWVNRFSLPIPEEVHLGLKESGKYLIDLV